MRPLAKIRTSVITSYPMKRSKQPVSSRSSLLTVVLLIGSRDIPGRAHRKNYWNNKLLPATSRRLPPVAQHKGARHTGGYPLSTPSTGSTLSTMVAPAPAADADPVLAPKLKLLGTTLVQCWARRDNDQHLDRRLSSTRLCPTYTCPGQPLVSTEVIIREPWGYTMIRNTRYDNL